MNYLTIGAIGAFFAATWSYISSASSQLVSRVILNVNLQGNSGEALVAYCFKNLNKSKFGHKNYFAWKAYIRPLNLHQNIIAECLGSTPLLFWDGWKPIWIKGPKLSENGHLVGDTQITVIRGMFDIDDMLFKAISDYNNYFQSTENKKFFITHLSGSVGKVPYSKDQMPSGEVMIPSDQSAFYSKRLIHWDLDDIGSQTHRSNALSYMALNDDALSVINKIKNWANSKDWFEEKGIPWKCGVLLHGKPGTGKTAFIRSVAEDLDIPIYSFDLSTFLNSELRENWGKLKNHSPSIALIEDIDGVFSGRDAVSDSIKLTFDGLLNCIDGVEITSGMLLFITTNNVRSLDPALGGFVNSDNMTSRPGRIDFSIEFDILTEAHRKMLAHRILKEWPDEIEEIVKNGKGDTGAQFERRCVDLCQNLYWSK